MPPAPRPMRLRDFERVVDRALESLPDWVVSSIDNLVVVVEDAPTEERGDLLGIYEGVALDEREDYSGAMPVRIVIYRQPHIEMW
ncbi:MAG: metallopeptidase family protein, partial [Acidimicrobiia bacterium]